MKQIDNLTIKLNDTAVHTYTLDVKSTHQFSFDVGSTDLAPDTYKITATTDANNNEYTLTGPSIFTVNKAALPFTVEAVDTVNYPGEVIVKVTTTVAGTFTVVIGDKSNTATIGAGETKSIKVSGVSAGNNQMVYVTGNPDDKEHYTGRIDAVHYDIKYNDFHTAKSIEVVAPSVIIADNIKRGVTSPYDYYATLLDDYGKPIAGREITFTIDGKTLKATTDAAGIAHVSANLTLVNDTDTVYNVVVTNPDTLENVTATTTIVPRLMVVSGDLTGDYLANPPYVVQAIGDDGNPVGENETVNVVFAGFGYDLKTNATGHVVRTIGLAPGMYAVKACYKGYNTTATVFVVNQILKVTSGTLKKTAKSYTLMATLKSSNGKALANKEFKLTFKGKTYNVFTNSKGVASKKISSSVIKTLKAGKTYTLQARYVNDIAKGKIKVVK